MKKEDLELLKLQANKAKILSLEDFDWFIFNVFRRSFGVDGFVGGDYIHQVAKHIQDNPFTIDVTGRDHFKSTRFYAEIMWHIFTNQGDGWEGHYFSYKADLAAYHLKKVKQFIQRNPYFIGLKDNKPTSESIIDYEWETGRQMTVAPQGLLAFKRGIHAEKVWLDDPLRDPENKMQPTSVLKVNNIVRAELMSMVKKGGTFRVVGTPQTPQDFFFDDNFTDTFAVWISPAIVDEPNKVVIWPEWKSYEELQRKKREIGDRAFAAEYMASPVYAENSYINKEKLLPLCVESSLDLDSHDILYNSMVYAGFDIGKKTHPSHFAVFVLERTTTGKKYRQLYSKWMDGWEYNRQLDYLNRAIKLFNISELRYDNTRAEFEGFVEQGKTNRTVMKPVVFTANTKSSMASTFAALVDRQEVTFVNEKRQTNQILSVTQDEKTGKLDAMAGPEGHGDAFWSCAMALHNTKRKPQVRWLE